MLKEEAVKLKFQNGAYSFVRLSTLSHACVPPFLFISITPAIMTFFFILRRGKGERQHFGAFLLLAEF